MSRKATDLLVIGLSVTSVRIVNIEKGEDGNALDSSKKHYAVTTIKWRQDEREQNE